MKRNERKNQTALDQQMLGHSQVFFRKGRMEGQDVCQKKELVESWSLRSAGAAKAECIRRNQMFPSIQSIAPNHNLGTQRVDGEGNPGQGRNNGNIHKTMSQESITDI